MTASPHRDSLVGQMLGRYRIVEKIGAGGMGEVYRARDERLERDVALKVLRAGTLTDETARRRFRKEALALSKLNHPNIATIFDFDTQAGVDFLVMEYVAGEPLDVKLHSGPMAEQEVARLGRQLAEGLAAAHAQGLIHRDLKPGNVRLTPDGRLKILDFGLARLIEPVTDSATTVKLTESRGLAGTPPYMAPEQLRGEAVDARSDIYAAGMVLYEMLTGQHPFRGARPDQLYRAILQEDPPPITKQRPDVPRRLEQITIRALEKRAVDRYGSAAELAEELAEVQRLLETSAALARGQRVLSRRARRRRAWAATVVMVVVAVAAGYVFQRLSVEDAGATSPALAVLPLASLLGDADSALLAKLVARMLTTDLGESAHLRVLASTALQNILKNQRLESASEFTSSELRGIARSANLSHVVVLSCFRAGNTLRADLEVLDVRQGQTVSTGSEEVEGEDSLVRMIDPLAARVRNALLSPKQLASEEDRPFGDITSNSQQAVVLFYQARELEAQGYFIQAGELYGEALALDPDFFLAKQHLAALRAGNEGIVEFEVLDGLSDYEKLLYDATKASVTQDFSQLLAVADQMLALRRADYVSMNYKYAAEFFLGRYRESAQTCESAIRSGYRGYFEHLFLNSSYGMLGMSGTEVVDRYHRLLEDDPSDEMMRFWLAVTFLSLNKDEEAQKLLDVVLRFYPENNALLQVLVDTYVWRDSPDKEADCEEALRYMHRLVALCVPPDSTSSGPRGGLDGTHATGLAIPLSDNLGPFYSYKLGDIYLRKGDLAAALGAYELSLKGDPGYYKCFYRLGQVHDQMGHSAKAVDYFQRYVNVKNLNWYDVAAQGREKGCAASKVCHSLSRPEAMADAEQRLARLR